MARNFQDGRADRKSAAFEDLLGRHLDDLYATALCFVGDEAAAEHLLVPDLAATGVPLPTVIEAVAAARRALGARLRRSLPRWREEGA